MRYLLTSTVVLLLTVIPAFSQGGAQPEADLSGGPFIGGGGIFNLDRNTSDLALEMGGALDLRLREQLRLTGSIGFLANVSDNDAFDDRSILTTAGMLYGAASSRPFTPFFSTGYAYAHGETASHHLFYAGAGIRHWYGETSGWQVEFRDYLNGDLNFIQVRLAVLLR